LFFLFGRRSGPVSTLNGDVLQFPNILKTRTWPFLIILILIFVLEWLVKERGDARPGFAQSKTTLKYGQVVDCYHMCLPGIPDYFNYYLSRRMCKLDAERGRFWGPPESYVHVQTEELELI